MTYPLLYRNLIEGNQPFIQDRHGCYHSLRKWLGFIGYSEIAILSGSYNPLHCGHLEVLSAMRSVGQHVYAEISVKHVTKPDVTEQDLYDRLLQFIGHFSVLVTNNALMVDKIGMLRQHDIRSVTIGCGIDVLDTMHHMHGSRFISALAATFIVFPRDNFDCHIPVCPNVQVYDKPLQYRSVSSTQIRREKEMRF